MNPQPSRASRAGPASRPCVPPGSSWRYGACGRRCGDRTGRVRCRCRRARLGRGGEAVQGPAELTRSPRRARAGSPVTALHRVRHDHRESRNARADVLASIPAGRGQSPLDVEPFQCQIVPSTVVTVTSALKPLSEPLPPVNWQAPSTSGTPLTRQWPNAVPPSPWSLSMTTQLSRNGWSALKNPGPK